jgi:hypothetical protein
MSDDDSQQNFILGFVMALIALLIFFVIGIVLWHKGHNPAAATATQAAAAQPAVVISTRDRGSDRMGCANVAHALAGMPANDKFRS